MPESVLIDNKTESTKGQITIKGLEDAMKDMSAIVNPSNLTILVSPAEYETLKELLSTIGILAPQQSELTGSVPSPYKPALWSPSIEELALEDVDQLEDRSW